MKNDNSVRGYVSLAVMTAVLAVTSGVGSARAAGSALAQLLEGRTAAVPASVSAPRPSGRGYGENAVHNGHDYNDNNNHGHDNDGNDHGGGWYPQEHFENSGCRDIEFTGPGANSWKGTIFAEESGRCRPSGGAYGAMECQVKDSYDREVSVAIGARDLKPNETEVLKVCISRFSAKADLKGMFYEYTVTAKDSAGGVFGGAHSELFLAPGARKPVPPVSKEVSFSVAPNAAGNLMLTVTDGAAADFGGEIVITADNFTDIGLNRTFKTAPIYQLKLLEVSRPGSYTLFFSYMRFWGSHHSEMVRLNKTFEVK
ncbi:MAG: hypothetical protein NTX59_00880 [Elusimicrobia bacterium]|nr:hypothetical protein [Elusimicrobiota bacterium]